MNTKDTTGNKANPTVLRDSDFRNFGNSTGSLKTGADVSDSMALAESEMTEETVEIRLSDLDCEVPDSLTVDVATTPSGLTIDRDGETFIVERELDGHALTGVAGREELPQRVPDWIEPVAALFGAEEVALGR